MTEPEKWERIVAQIQAGGAAGQEALYEMFGRGVRFYFANQLQAEDIEDKVHDTFLTVLAAIRAGQVREPARLAGFVRTIAQRQVAGYIAEAVRRRSEAVDPDEELSALDEGPDPEQEAILRDRREFARRILQALPVVDREILTLFYFDGRRAEQICRQLKITETQFRLRKHRAKERFSELAREAMKKRKPPGQVLLRKQAAAGH